MAFFSKFQEIRRFAAIVLFTKNVMIIRIRLNNSFRLTIQR